MAKSLWDFRRKLFKRAYEQGLIDFPEEATIKFTPDTGERESTVKWKIRDHKLIYDKIHIHLNDFWKLYNQKKLTVEQIIDIINTRKSMEIRTIMERMKKPRKYRGTPPIPEKEGYTFHWVITSRDKKNNPETGYWRGMKK